MTLRDPGSVVFPVLRVALDRAHLVAFARATGQTDPRYLDLDAARAAGHPDVVAAPTYLFCLDRVPPARFSLVDELGIDLSRVLHGAQRFEYLADAHAGEHVEIRRAVVDHFSKKGGALEFVVQRSRVLRGAEPVAVLETTMIVRNEVDG